jgi:hypothetical protein
MKIIDDQKAVGAAIRSRSLGRLQTVSKAKNKGDTRQKMNMAVNQVIIASIAFNTYDYCSDNLSVH